MTAIVVVGKLLLPDFGDSATVAGSTISMTVGEKTVALRPRTLPGAGFCRHPACAATRSARDS